MTRIGVNALVCRSRPGGRHEDREVSVCPRDECFSEETRIEDLLLDPAAFPTAERLQQEENLGRLRTTTAFPTAEPATELYSFGGRSFSIWDAAGKLVFDSGNDFERITAAVDRANFNSTNNEKDSFDSRSDDKGPEPEGIEIGQAFGST